MTDDVTHSGGKLFNQLPDNIKSELNFDLFKILLKRYLLESNSSLIKNGQFSTRNLKI